MTEIIYQLGLPEKFVAEAVDLYDEAFGQKFAVAVRCTQKRRLLLSDSFMLEYAIVAISEERLIGIVGFHTPKGSLTGKMTYAMLISRLGFIKGHWAALIFALYERQPSPQELVMDGIAVRADVRGRGVGGRLLEELVAYATAQKYKSIRLDVIDINPKAKKLYERKGFVAIKTDTFPYLRWLLGFGGVTTMKLNIQI